MHNEINLSGTYANFSMGGFFDDVSSNVQYQRSYVCKAHSQYNFTNFTNQELSVSINVTNFQVQVFEFKDNKAKFGNREFLYICTQAVIIYDTIWQKKKKKKDQFMQ